MENTSEQKTLFDKIGRPNVILKDLPDIQLDFLQELCKLWPFTLERWEALRERRGSDLSKIALKEKPVIENARNFLTALWYLRLKLEEKCTKAGEQYQKAIIERCRNDFTFFINYWCWIYDPRMPEIGLSAKLPFIMYPAQERILKHVELCYRTRQSSIIDKSREAGISWGVCALLTHHWLFVPGFSVILGSEKEEKVDMLGSTQPLMGKIRYLLYNLPPWMRPRDFRGELPSKIYDNYRRITNPEINSEIKGEAGLNIGRSGRASMVVIDESQDLSHPEAVDEALESVMNCRIDIGTPKGMNHFGKKRWSGTVLVESIHWYDDPRKNPRWRDQKENPSAPWFEYKRRTVSPEVLAQEYLLDYQSSVEGLVIPPEWVRSAVDFNLPDTGARVAGFDVAGGGSNKSIYVLRSGPVLKKVLQLPYNTSTESTWGAINIGEEDGILAMNYDADGLGESIWGQLKTSDRRLRFRINAIHGAGKPSDKYLDDEGKYAHEKYGNRRAEIWFHLRDRFKRTYEHRNGVRAYPADQLISIPDNAVLINQLCSPKIDVMASGKLLIESKKSMRSRGIESPDEADATAYAFADYEGEGYVVENFDYTKSENFEKFDINWERCPDDNYVSIMQMKDMSVYGVCALFNYSTKILRVYGEFDIASALPSEVMSRVYEISHAGQRNISEWIGNEEMFVDIEKSTKTVWHQYRKAGIKLQRSFGYDEGSGILTVNQMFSQNKMVIHASNCLRLFSQLREWRSHGGKPDDKLSFAQALCQLVARLKRKKAIVVGNNSNEIRRSGYGIKRVEQRTFSPAN
jgi:hypothetical protein